MIEKTSIVLIISNEVKLNDEEKENENIRHRSAIINSSIDLFRSVSFIFHLIHYNRKRYDKHKNKDRE